MADRLSDQPLLHPRFVRNVGYTLLIALAVVGFWLAAGMLGYAVFEGMGTVDAFANAAMILSGMGPLAPLNSTAGKIFAGLYAILSGLLLILVTGLILTPVLHRVLYRFHLEKKEEADEQDEEADAAGQPRA